MDLLDNPRKVRTLEGQLDLLAAAAARVERVVQAPPPPPPPKPQAVPAPAPPPSVREPLPAPPAALPAVLVSTVEAKTGEVELGPAAQAYLARLLDKGKRAYAERVLRWISAGEKGERPAWSSVPSMNEMKALDVDRTIARILQPREAAPKSTTKERLAEKPVIEEEPSGPSPLKPSFEPAQWTTESGLESVLYRLRSDIDRHEKTARTGKHFGERMSDAYLASIRENALRGCARAQEALTRMPKANREAWDAKLDAFCDFVRTTPIPWKKRGKVAEQMQRAWEQGKLAFRNGLWRMGRVAGADAALVFQSATNKTPYPLVTEAEILAEMQAHDANSMASTTLGEETVQSETARKAHHQDLVRAYNAKHPRHVSIGVKWYHPETYRDSEMSAIVTPYTPSDLSVLHDMFRGEGVSYVYEKGSEHTKPLTGVEYRDGYLRRTAGEKPTTHEGLLENAQIWARIFNNLGFSTEIVDYSETQESTDSSDVHPIAAENIESPFHPSRKEAMVELVVGSSGNHYGGSFYVLDGSEKGLKIANGIIDEIQKTLKRSTKLRISRPQAATARSGLAWRVDFRVQDYENLRKILFTHPKFNEVELPVALSVRPDFWSSSSVMPGFFNQSVDVLETSLSRIEDGFPKYERGRATAGVLDSWMRNIVLWVLKDGDRIMRFFYSQNQEKKANKVYSALQKIKEGNVPWEHLRVGSPNARAVTQAVVDGTLTIVPTGQGTGVWSYRGKEGASAWEAFRAGSATR